MSGSTNLIRQFYQVMAGNQLGNVIAQVDTLAELAADYLRPAFAAAFYRKPGSNAFIPIAYLSGDDSTVTGLNHLEKAWRSPVRLQLLNEKRLVDLAGTSTAGNEPADRFAESNGFRYRLQYAHPFDDNPSVLVVTYWRDRPETLGNDVDHYLRLLSEALMAVMSSVEQQSTVNDFSIRLGELLSVFELQTGDHKFRDLISGLVRHARLVVPVSGICLLSRDRETGKFEVAEFFDRKPARAAFTTELIERTDQEFPADRRTERNGRCWHTLTNDFQEDCTAIVAVEMRTDKKHQYVLVAWTRRPSGFCGNDLELLTLFGLTAETVLKTAQIVKGLRKSHRTLEKSSSRMADVEVLAALTDMTSGVAHDFNNIIGGIVGRVQLMKLRISNEVIRDDLDKIETQALEGAETIRRIQEFTTCTKYKQLEPVDLCEVVESGLDSSDASWRNSAEEKGVAVRFDSAVDQAVLDGCRDDLLTALDKLIENAVEHSPDNATVHVTLKGDEKQFELLVTDSGPGVPEEIKNRLFYPFFSTKNTRAAGMGLAVVHSIVVRHGGKVGFDTSNETGTTFWITFKRPADVREDSEITRKTKRSARLNVLVVDDDKQIREILSDMLTIDGHTATACADGYSALEALTKQAFDLIITDLGMPGMSGLDLAGRVHEMHPDLPIAMITGWGAQLNEDEVLLKGIKTVLPKPFHLKDVKALVKDLVTH